MTLFSRLRSGLRLALRNILKRSLVESEMDAELRFHLEAYAEDLMRAGVPQREAVRRARLEFGGMDRTKEECREARGGNSIETVFKDVVFSLRLLRKSPGFTIAAAVTLAFAIGANAVVFGVMDGLVLRPLNVPQPENLYGTEYGIDTGFQSYPNYLDLRDRNHSFEDLAAFTFAFGGLDTGKNPAVAEGFAVTGNYFDVLRLHPFLGRFFDRSDERGPNSAPYIVLSHAYWHSRFQDDRGVVGRTVLLNTHPYTIIGVAPREFSGTLRFVSPDFFMPIVNEEQVNGENILNARGNFHGVFEVFGHLKPGVTLAQALADVNVVGAYLAESYPKEFGQKGSVLGRTGLSSFGNPLREFMTGLMLLAGLILVAACANLGSLFAARAADRSREIALRLALGSSRNRILRQLLTEATLISLIGGAVGLAASVVLVRRLSMWQVFPGAPIHLPVSPDAKIYVVALALALVSGLLFGIVPVRQVLRADPYEIVKAGSSGRVGRRITVRDLLLGAQIAICAVLVTSSLVAARGLLRSLHGNFGFEPRNTMLASTNLTMAGYNGDRIPTMQKLMIHAVETIPGVDHVGFVNNFPPLLYGAGSRENVFTTETQNNDLRPAKAAAMPYRYDVSPEYFAAAGTTVLAGKSFSWHDDDKVAPRVAVVNQEFAHRIFGGVNQAVGRYYKMQDGTRVEVVGVVEDGKYLSFTENQQPAMFLPFLLAPVSQCFLIVRSSRDPQQLASAMRSKLRELDAAMPVNTGTWNSQLEVALFPSRVATSALGILGIMGAMLSITGIFGMAAYSVSKRLRELGIRIALGGRRQEVLHAALGRAVKLLALGSVAGLLLGILASRVLALIVYSATPRDPLVLGGAVLAMALLGLLATWIPARRALSVDPLILLREE